MTVPDSRRQPARHPMPILLPVAAVALAATVVAIWISKAMLLDVSPVVPHLSIVLALSVSFVGISALVAVSINQPTVRAFSLGLLGFAFAVLWLLFYVALLFTLVYLGELPTRHILVGYAPELMVLFKAAPLTLLSKGLLLIGGVLLLILAGALSGYCFARSAAALRALIASPRLSIAFRAALFYRLQHVLVRSGAAVA